MNYTSRSSIEDYQSCPRLRYNNQFLLGKGVVAKKKSVPLVTGGRCIQEYRISLILIG